jgi:hypothetical protein
MGLIAEYALNEGSGTTAAEIGGGTAITGVPEWATGRQGSAIFVNLSDGIFIDPFAADGPYTIMFDVYVVGGGSLTYNMLVHGPLGTLQEFNESLEFYPVSAVYSGVLPRTTWKHVAISATNNSVYTFVDGVLLAAETDFTPPAYSGLSSGWRMGSQGGGAYTGNFRFDNLRIFDHAMTTGAEVLPYVGLEVTAPGIQPLLGEEGVALALEDGTMLLL